MDRLGLVRAQSSSSARKIWARSTSIAYQTQSQVLVISSSAQGIIIKLDKARILIRLNLVIGSLLALSRCERNMGSRAMLLKIVISLNIIAEANMIKES